jgi:hypothetical protein
MGVPIHKQAQQVSSIHLKKHGVDLSRLPEMCVKVVLDVTGSFKEEFDDGHIQAALSRLFGFAINMDKSEQMQVITFEQRAHTCRYPVTHANVDTYIRDHILNDNSVPKWGATLYAPAIHAVYEASFPDHTHLHSSHSLHSHLSLGGSLGGAGHGLLSGMKSLFHHKAEVVADAQPSQGNFAAVPTLVLFITDGANNDHEEARRAFIAASEVPIFFALIGVGPHYHFDFLREMADSVSDCEFVNLEHVRQPDEQLFSQLITPKLTSWLKSKHV